MFWVFGRVVDLVFWLRLSCPNFVWSVPSKNISVHASACVRLTTYEFEIRFSISRFSASFGLICLSRSTSSCRIAPLETDTITPGWHLTSESTRFGRTRVGLLRCHVQRRRVGCQPAYPSLDVWRILVLFLFEENA